MTDIKSSAKKRFLLVHPEISRTKYNFAGVIDNEPLELEYIYALLKSQGYEPDIWDGQVEKISLVQKLKAFMPEYVYVCGRTRQESFIKEYCAAAKKICGSITIAADFMCKRISDVLEITVMLK
ncbi:MAG: hypothetical protein PUA81_06330 [Oscillospiraceae bacterium]|nr:hypothetical protein [Oscillospiraceae bacterium]